MLGQFAGRKERVVGREQKSHVAVVGREIRTKLHGLVVHRLPQFGIELGKTIRIRTREFVETINAEPLSEHFGRQSTNSRIAHHASHLGDPPGRIA